MFFTKIKNISFIRFGGLSALKQDHYITDPEKKTFHNPPVKRGIYAFPEKYIEYFLIGGTSNPDHISGKAEYVKDDNGEKIKIKNEDCSYDYDTDKYIFPKEINRLIKKRGYKQKNLRTICISGSEDDASYSYLTHIKKPRIFNYTGEIWSHLIDSVEQTEIIEIKGSWVKTTYADYINALNRYMHISMRELRSKYSDFNDVDTKRNIKVNNPYKWNPTTITYSRDTLEVFIEGI
jgi:hypothetical protein